MRFFWAIFLLAWITKAWSIVTVNVTESSGVVTFSASGTANFNGLTYGGTGTGGHLSSGNGLFQTGTGSQNFDYYNGTINGPTNFGTSPTYYNAVSGSGSVVGINQPLGRLYVPSSYTSGAALSGNANYTGTISSLGLTPGTYTWTWGSGGNADSLVLTITSPVSAPTSTTGAASSITTTGATLNGTVNDNGASTTVTFNYGSTNAYGSSVTAPQSPVAAGAGSTAVSAALTGLTCNTTYHFRVSASNNVNTTNGSDATFTTSACAVAVPTLSEWTQLMLALMVMTVIGWHFHRERSY